jgi:hypothetical protein
VEASASEVGSIQDYWHNYDIHKSLRPKLLPDEDFTRAQTLLYAFRIHYAKSKKQEIKQAKEQAIQHHYAWKIQQAVRQKFARAARRAKELDRERENDELKRYNAFKRKLLEGIEFKVCFICHTILSIFLCFLFPLEKRLLICIFSYFICV